MRIFRKLTWVPLALFIALPAHAGFEPVEGPEMDVTNPEQGAGWYEGQYGMTPEQSRRFDSGGGVRVILPPNSRRASQAQDDDDTDGAALSSQGAQDYGGAAVDPGPILDATGHGIGSSRDLIDSVGEVPLPSREAPQGLAGGFGANSPLTEGESAPTEAAASKARLLDNLRRAPAYTPRQMSGFEPETAQAANGSDYGLRVLGQDAHAQMPLPVQASQAAAPSPSAASAALGSDLNASNTPPVSVLIEMRLSPSNDETDSEASPAKALDTRVQSLVKQGFVVDKSFPLLASSADQRSAFVRGWMDPDRLMLLALNPAVARVTVVGSPGPQEAGASPLRVPVTLHLRLRRGEGLSAFLRRSLPSLERRAGFEWRVSQGWQLQPTSEGGAVVLSGELPSGSVGKLLEYPDLIRVEPFLAAAGSASGRGAAGVPPVPHDGATRRALDFACLSLAFPWMGILFREIFFWLRFALY